MKRTFLPLLLALSLLVLPGCADLEEPADDGLFGDLSELYTPDEKPSDTALRAFALPYFKGQTLDPITCADGVQQTLGALLYDGLFALDEQFVLRPALATECSYDGADVYTVTVRSGVTFSDGTPLTAADVVETLQRARTCERYAARLAEVTSVTGSGNTVRITLAQPCGGFAARLDIPIVKSGTEEDTVPIGTGRYRWAEEDGVPYLAPNPYRWQQAQLPIERIELKACKDQDSVLYAFYAREVQLLSYDLTGTGGSTVSGGGDCHDAPTTTMQYIGFNTASPLFSDPALRAAMSAGIDRAGCVNAYLLGHGAAAQFPMAPSSGLYPADMELPYSPDDFTAALAEAGYQTGVERPATLVVNGENGFRVQAARKIAEDLSLCDVKITVSVLPWEEYQAALREGAYDLYYGECRLTADWDLDALLSEAGALNFSDYTDETLPALLDAVHAAVGESRGEAFRALYVWLQANAPFAPVCFKSVSVLTPTDAIDGLAPTASDPFYRMSEWQIRWAEDAS